MTDPTQLRLGDRTIWIVRPQDVERWSESSAAGVLREAAESWPDREALVGVSDALHGPEELAPALAFLADAIDRGTLVAVRLPDGAIGLAGLGDEPGAWDDAPRLSDLGDDPAEARKDGPGGSEPTRVVPSVPGRGAGGDAVLDDPAATFVAFAVFDQHGRAMRGTSECAVDGGRHSHALEGAMIEIRPVRHHATIDLVLAELEPCNEVDAAADS